MEKIYLEIRNLTFSFPNSKVKIFNNLNLNVSLEQPIIGIVGSNGSGKSLLAKIITGLEKPNSGKISLFGHDVTKLKTRQRLSYVSMSFQMVNNIFIRQSVAEEINYTQNVIKKLMKGKLGQISTDVNMSSLITKKSNQHPLTLSGGEKRKLYFTLLRILDPQIYILDEPTVGLDYYGINDLSKEIKTLLASDKKIIIITHNIKFLLSLTDQVIILEKDASSGISFISYNGSLRSYLFNQSDKNKSFLSIPLEFELYKEKVLTNQIPEAITYREFLQKNSTRAD